MDQDQIIKEMAKKIVETMDDREAKDILLSIVQGADPYETIVGVSGTQEAVKPRKKRTRKNKIWNEHKTELVKDRELPTGQPE